MTHQDSYGVIYNSDLIIADGLELSTLCVFLDKVYVPHTSEETWGHCVRFVAGPSSPGQYKLDTLTIPSLRYVDATGQRKLTGQDVEEWMAEYDLLFQKEILNVLPPPRENRPRRQLVELLGTDFSSMVLRLPNFWRTSRTAPNGWKWESIFLREDHLLHLLRTDVTPPSVFVLDPNPPREALRAILAKELFRYYLPALSGLKAEQIVQVREKVNDTREGFTMHLQKLTKEIDKLISEGARSEEIEAVGRRVVVTEIIPDYFEFKRQLAAERAGFWGKVLDKVAKAFEIDAAPWTPKFYGELVVALGFAALETTRERKEALSNKKQAFQFMRRLEKEVDET